MANLKSQVQSQYGYAMSHKGKAIGSTLGIIAGVSYGLAGKQSNWVTAGLAIAGAVGGAILGGMFDKQPSIVVPVSNGDNGGGKTPVVNDTVGMDTENDTAGEDGEMLEARGSRNRSRSRNSRGFGGVGQMQASRARKVVKSGGVGVGYAGVSTGKWCKCNSTGAKCAESADFGCRCLGSCPEEDVLTYTPS